MNKETSEYEKLKARGFKDYSFGHQRMYLGPIELIARGEKPISVLDIGSGIGWGCAEMFTRISNLQDYLGVEPSRDSWAYHLEMLTKKVDPKKYIVINSKWEEARVSSCKYSFCIEVIEHVEKEKHFEFIQKIREYTEKTLFLSTPEVDKNPHGVLKRWEVLELLDRCGFKNVVVIDEHWTTLYIAQ